MGLKVSNLNITLQKGTDNSYYASWDFKETVKTTSNSAIKKGDIVSIKSGAKWYNGVKIPNWVLGYKWYVVQVKGDRAVLGKNANGSGNHDIQSPIRTSDLIGASGSSSSTSTSKDVTNVDHYEVKWYYATGNGVYFTGTSEDSTRKLTGLYSPPDNATKIKVTVKPVSKKYKTKDGKTEKSYWTGESVSKELVMASTAPPDADKPTVVIEDYTLRATVLIPSEEKDEKVQYGLIDRVEFQVYTGNVDTGAVSKDPVAKGIAEVKALGAVFICTVAAGSHYYVRCRYINDYDGKKLYGEWSGYADAGEGPPKAVNNVKVVADSKTSAKLTWKSSSNSADISYEIEYTTDKKYFDTSSSQLSSKTSGAKPNTNGVVTDIIDSLESGKEWFFRIRATKDSANSSWSNIVSTELGTSPEAPTTWSLTSSVIVGEDITLYWTHNTKDGSKMTKAEIELIPNGGEGPIEYTPEEITDEDEAEPIHSYTFSSADYTVGGKISWRVRTKGIYDEGDNKGWSGWSTLRDIDLYATPSAMVTTNTGGDNIMSTFPLDMTVTAGPEPQKPLSYHVAIISTNTYESTDILGRETVVNAGAAVYSKVFNVTDNVFNLSISAGDVLLVNNQEYKVRVTVSMDSGLTAEAISSFTTSWEDALYVVDAGITIDFDTLSAYITPFCNSVYNTIHVKMEGEWTTSVKTYAYDMCPEIVEEDDNGFTIQYVENGVTKTKRYETYEEETYQYTQTVVASYTTEEPDITDVTLSVYRREYNGSFTCIATGLTNSGVDTVTDPHPSLDLARYRIVAQDAQTGKITYSDLPGHPVNEHSIIIQWDEKWVDFDYSEDGIPEIASWTGSMLKLPYNINVSEKYNPDVSLVEYIGRENPVSYYGTQRGETASWSTVIDKADKETIYALRRLAAWKGDVYIREPSGTGYWAHVKVSFPINYQDLTVPVTFDISRVEGGI